MTYPLAQVKISVIEHMLGSRQENLGIAILS